MGRCAAMFVALALNGCPNPHTYSPPRTLPKGKTSHAFALEVYELRTESDQRRMPSGPTYVYRRGLSDEIDGGIRAVNATSFGADLKYNFLRSDVDLAIDPGFQWQFLQVDDTDSMFAMLDLPLLIGLNLAPELTIDLGAGAVMLGGDALGWAESEELSNEQFFVRGTIGLDLRLNQRIAVHPSVTYLSGITTGTASAIVGGCALRLGGPIYDDLSY
jgi:hypothetical protein